MPKRPVIFARTEASPFGKDGPLAEFQVAAAGEEERRGDLVDILLHALERQGAAPEDCLVGMLSDGRLAAVSYDGSSFLMAYVPAQGQTATHRLWPRGGACVVNDAEPFESDVAKAILDDAFDGVPLSEFSAKEQRRQLSVQRRRHLASTLLSDVPNVPAVLQAALRVWSVDGPANGHLNLRIPSPRTRVQFIHRFAANDAGHHDKKP